MASPAVIQGFFPGGPPGFAVPRPLTAQPQGLGLPGPAFAPRPAALAAPRPHPPAAAVQRIPNGTAMQLPAHLASLPAMGGQPLPAALREPMEAFFGTRFGDVRIHVGPHVPAIGALAFTRGSEIHFSPGHYNPGTARGRELLGHELTHIVQQRAGRVRNPFGTGTAVVQDSVLEAEAHRMGQRAAAYLQLPRMPPMPPTPPMPRTPLSPVQAKPAPALGPIRGLGARPLPRIVQCMNYDVRPNSPRAQQINDAKGVSWDSMNTTSTIEFDPPHPEYGDMGVFSLQYNADRSDMASQLGYDTITYRDKSDLHLHSEMLLVMDMLTGKIDKDHIVSWGVNRKICRYCGIVLQHESFSVPYDHTYIPKNWTNPYKLMGLSKTDSPVGVPWQ